MAKYLGSINSTAARMFTMLNELLDVTSIELGQIFGLEAVNLSQLLKHRKGIPILLTKTLFW
jgi:signal transduction histidine kinase